MHKTQFTLFVLAVSLCGAMVAQELPSDVAPTETMSFSVGGALVRVVTTAGVASASVSRNGGSTFQPLPPIDHALYLRAGTFDPRSSAPSMKGALAAPTAGHLFIVQTATSILPEYRRALIDSGLEIIGYFPMNAYVVRGGRQTASSLNGQAWVRWVGELPVGYKLEEQLVPLVAESATVSAPPVEYNVVLAQKSDRSELAAAIGRLGGEVSKLNDGSVYLQAWLSPAQLAAVAALDTVIWIDTTGQISTDMDNARIQGNANYVETIAGYTGTGVRAEISEGVQQTHPDWTNPVLVRYDATDSHGHCTASIVGLNGAGMLTARGVMPNCQIIESAYTVWGYNTAGNRYNLIQGSVNPALAWKAMQQTASWGHPQTLLYTSVSQEMDNALFDFDLAVTQSQSNTGNQTSRPQAWAKNIISVGAVVHANNSNPGDDIWQGASIGPASDGRLKPDICAYYDQILTGDLVGASGYSATNYYTGFGGTSGATPIVNGYLGLIQQMYTDGIFGNPLPLAATSANRFQNKPKMTTAKALLTNTASSYPFSGAAANLTRTHQGWGFPDARRVYDNRQKLVVLNEYDVLTQGQSKSYAVWIRPSTPEFRATMVYADPEALANAAIHRINSVDLKVVRAATGETWWGNNGLNVGNVSTSGGVANDRDTIEHVWLANPPSGIYIVTVSAPTIVQDGRAETPALDVDFALVMHPVGGGYKNNSVTSFDIQSPASGDLRAVVTGAPAAGWTHGYTLYSLNTAGQPGFGTLCGLQDDALTVALVGLPAVAGDAFHFTNVAGNYPFVQHIFPPALATALGGVTVDGILLLLDAGGNIVGLSNVDRATITP